MLDGAMVRNAAHGGALAVADSPEFFEVIMADDLPLLGIEELESKGTSALVVARWSREDYLNDAEPTEAMFKPYSVKDGKVCWLAELSGEHAIDVVANLTDGFRA